MDISMMLTTNVERSVMSADRFFWRTGSGIRAA
jgi:hypothetical protein